MCVSWLAGNFLCQVTRLFLLQLRSVHPGSAAGQSLPHTQQWGYHPYDHAGRHIRGAPQHMQIAALLVCISCCVELEQLTAVESFSGCSASRSSSVSGGLGSSGSSTANKAAPPSTAAVTPTKSCSWAAECHQSSTPDTVAITPMAVVWVVHRKRRR